MSVSSVSRLLIPRLVGVALLGGAASAVAVDDAAAQSASCLDVAGTLTLGTGTTSTPCLTGQWSPPAAQPAIVAGSSGGSVLEVYGTQDSAYDGAFTGSMVLVKTGTGTLTLSQENDHAGSLTGASLTGAYQYLNVAAVRMAGATSQPPSTMVAAGRLAVTTPTALGTGAVLLGADGTIAFATPVGTDATLTNFIEIDSHPAAYGGRATIEVATGSRITLAGTVDGIHNPWLTGSSTYSLTRDDYGHDAGLVKTGGGTLRLTGDNSWGGGTTIEAGTLSVSHVAALGRGPRGSLGAETRVTIREGATLELSGVELAPINDPALVPTLSCLSSGGPCGTATIAVEAVIGGDDTFVMVAPVAGDAGLRKAGAGVLALAGSGLYIGETVVAAGVLRLDATDALSETSGVVIEDGATLRFGIAGLALGPSAFKLSGAARIDTAGYDGRIDAAIADDPARPGQLIKAGTGTLTLAGAGTWRGGTTIEAGRLTMAAGATLPTVGTVTIAGGGVLDVGGQDQTIGGLAGAAGAVVVNGAAGAAVLTVGGDGGSTRYDGSFVEESGAGALRLVKTGAGTLTLGGASSHSGGTVLSQGTLILAASGALGSGRLDLAGGTTLAFGANGVSVAPSSVRFSGVGRFDSAGFDGEIAAAIADDGTTAGRFVKTGAGRLTLAGPGSWRGGTTIDAGRLTLAGAGALPTVGTVTIAAGAVLDLGGRSQTIGGLAGAAGSRVVNGATGPATLTIGGDGGDMAFAGSFADEAGTLRLVKAGAGTLTLTGASSHSGGTAVRAGTLVLGSTAALGTGPLDLADGTTLAFALGAGRHRLANAIVFSGVDDPTIDTGGSTVALDGVISGSGFLTKTGAGTLIMTATETYTGTTMVAAGTLEVDGSIAASPLTTVLAGATLAGTGTVGSLAVYGTVAPGNADTTTGVLTVAGDARLAAGSTLAVTVDATSASKLAVAGTASLDGTVVATAGTSLPAGGTRRAIVTTGAGTSGQFAGLLTYGFGGLGTRLIYDGSSVFLQFGPSPVALAGSVAKLVEDRQGQMMTGRVLTSVLLGVNEQINCSNCISSFASVGSFSAGIHGRASIDEAFAIIGGIGWASWESGGARVQSSPMVAASIRWDPADRGPSRPFVELGATASPAMRVRYERSLASGTTAETAVGTTDAAAWAVFGRIGWVSRFDARNEAAVSVDLWTGWQRSNGYAESGAAGTTVGVMPAALDRSSVVKLGGQWTHLWGQSLETQVNLGVATSFGSKSGLSAQFSGYGGFGAEPRETVWAEFGGRIGWRLRKTLIVDAFVDGTLGPRPVGNTAHGGLGLRLGF